MDAAPTIDAAVMAGVLLGPTESSLQVPRNTYASTAAPAA
jgi:hypothetical protein